jgi:signal transduction histidine kinase
MSTPAAAAVHSAHSGSARSALNERSLDGPETVEAELRRVAFDLHDGPAQSVAAAQLILDRALSTGDPAVVRAQAARACEILAEAMRELRQLMGELVPPELAAESLTGRLAEHVHEYERRFGVGVTLHIRGPVEGLPEDVRDALFRIIQEGLTNVRRHACARTARVEVVAEEGVVTCRVIDHGCGFDTAPHMAGLGVASMRERARAHGGELLILSTPGSGTTVEASIPVAPR